MGYFRMKDERKVTFVDGSSRVLKGCSRAKDIVCEIEKMGFKTEEIECIERIVTTEVTSDDLCLTCIIKGINDCDNCNYFKERSLRWL